MCGLSFLYDPSAPPAELAARAGRAVACLVHRGPDEEGVEVRAPWAIGHRRLAIIDLAGSRQPMPDREERRWLAFNGQVYNYRELRSELEGRWEFRNAGDTEVLLAGLALDGPAFLDRIEGMWALLLWDSAERRLLLARDRFGKKPLYFRARGDRIACASELPALERLLADGEALEEDPASSADYLRYGYHLPGSTAYRGVGEVLPGSFATWSPEAGGEPRQERYFRLRLGGGPAGGGEHERMRSAFVTAVSRRLVADVEVGAFLSGGIDSSLVVGTMAGELGHRPRTFTIGFEETAFDERPFARRVAERWGTDHHERVLARWDRDRLVRLVRDHVGQPFADSSLLPTSMVSELAGEHVKVVLSGDGGDEVMGGYQRYLARSLLRWYSRVPRPLRGVAEAALRALPEPMAHHSRSLLKKAHLFLDIVARQEAERPYVAPLLWSPEDFVRLAPELAGLGHEPPGLPPECRADDVLEMMCGDLAVYLPQDILVKVDRAAMAHSVEVRSPFLDRGLVELAFALPRHRHLRGLTGKRMLRETFADLVPSELWKRRKQGFAVPVHRWFREGLEGELADLLERDPGPISAPFVERLVTAHRTGRRDHGYRLWMLYVHLLWRTEWRRS